MKDLIAVPLQRSQEASGASFALGSRNLSMSLCQAEAVKGMRVAFADVEPGRDAETVTLGGLVPLFFERLFV